MQVIVDETSLKLEPYARSYPLVSEAKPTSQWGNLFGASHHAIYERGDIPLQKPNEEGDVAGNEWIFGILEGNPAQTGKGRGLIGNSDGFIVAKLMRTSMEMQLIAFP